MINSRKTDDDILKDWFIFREQSFCTNIKKEDSKHFLLLDEIFDDILENTTKDNQKFIKEKLDMINKDVLDYVVYWNEKYYKNGFCDGIKLITSAIEN